jgi:DNA-directed RNA polymerase specialized sigma24 family protein
METPAAIRLLPGAYAAAIVLDHEGVEYDRIGTLLGIDAIAVGPLLAIARAKLAALEDGRAGADLGEQSR